MAVLAGGSGSWLDHSAEDARRKNHTLEQRVAHLEARVEQLEAKLGDEPVGERS